MLVCGTSAVVFPFASLPRVAKQKVTGLGFDVGFYVNADNPPATVIEVNFEPTPLTEEGISDYFIRGKTGEILPAIAREVKKILDS